MTATTTPETADVVLRPIALPTPKAAEFLGISTATLKTLPFDVLPWYRGERGRTRYYDVPALVRYHERRLAESAAAGGESVSHKMPIPPTIAAKFAKAEEVVVELDPDAEDGFPDLDALDDLDT